MNLIHCKECRENKRYTEYYAFNQDNTGRCKECVKRGRRSEKERKMARMNDNKRSKTPERLKINTENTKQWRKDNPEKYKANGIVNNYYRYHKEDKPTQCSNCGVSPTGPRSITLHHEDYSKPREVIALCHLCHKQHHSGIIKIDLSKIIIIPF